MFKAAINELPSGSHYRIFEDGAPLSFRRFFELLESDMGFADWYGKELGDFEAEAFYWELPPLTRATLVDDAEFVLIEAPMLARFPPERAPFASYFDRSPDEDVIVFPNLGGDAILIAPCPRGPDENYPHLAAFLRGAGQQQLRALWRKTAQEMLRNIGDRPTWLSTAGGGVAWLHIRLDSRPKYYSYGPYRSAEL